MAIMARSTSFRADLAAYLATRILTLRVLALWLLVGAAIVLVAGTGAASAAELAGAGLVAGLLIVQLRLWDDLADRARDRSRAPDRVLVRTRHGACFALLVLATAVLLGASWLLQGSLQALFVYVVLLGVLGLLYHSQAGAALSRPVRASLLLAKYPLIVLIVVTSFRTGPLPWWPAIGLYGLLLAYEWRDDRELRSSAALPAVAACWALGAALVWAAFRIA